MQAGKNGVLMGSKRKLAHAGVYNAVVYHAVVYNAAVYNAAVGTGSGAGGGVRGVRGVAGDGNPNGPAPRATYSAYIGHWPSSGSPSGDSPDRAVAVEAAQ